MSPSPEHADPTQHDLVPAARCETLFEAQTKAVVLRDAGIDAHVFEGDGIWLGMATPRLSAGQVPVLVARCDRERAIQTLAQATVTADSIDWTTSELPDEIDRETIAEARRDNGVRVIVFLVILILVVWAIIQFT